VSGIWPKKSTCLQSARISRTEVHLSDKNQMYSRAIYGMLLNMKFTDSGRYFIFVALGPLTFL
jgi:hypothetical protein